MAPAPTATANRPMAQPSRQRYFKGKAPELAQSSDSEDDEDEQVIQKQKKVQAVQVDRSLVAGGAGRIIPDGGFSKTLPVAVMKVDLRDVKIDGGRVIKEEDLDASESEEESDEEEVVKPKFGLPKPVAVGGEESSEYETDSEEESEEEKKPAFRPVFVRKDARGVTQEQLAAEAEARVKAEEAAQEQRKLDSKDLAGETIRRELAEREAKDVQPDVDDTDGQDPAAEFDAWRARELHRLVRDKEAQAAADLEREEIERRRAMPEDERLAEDMAYAQSTRDQEKGEMGFLQKYYHKGAFHQDDELLKRDYTAATENAIDMSNLPAVMQVRDFGKRSRTKYTHLVDQDTSGTGWGKAHIPAPGSNQQGGQFSQGCWNCGGDHMRKDCPNNDLSDAANQLASVGASTGGGYGGHSMGPPQSYGGDRSRQDGRDRPADERSDRPRDSGWGGRSSRPDERRERDRDDGRNRGRSDRDRDRDHQRGYDRERDYDRSERDRDRRSRDDRRERSRSPGRRRDDRERDRDRDRRDEGRRRDDRERDYDRRR